MTDQLPENIRARKSQCETCVFRPESQGGIHLAPGRHAEIREMLLSGGNQLCHHDKDQTICAGGRMFQLEMWARLGVIAEPTEEALREAMLAAGVEPARHLYRKSPGP